MTALAPNHLHIYRDRRGKHITLDGQDLLLDGEDPMLITGMENPAEVTRVMLTLLAPKITIDSEIEDREPEPATVDAPAPTIAEELLYQADLLDNGDPDGDAPHALRTLAARAEQVEHDLAEARAEVERLTAERDDRPAADLPNPADVPVGQAWIVEYHGDDLPALRRLDHPGDWYLVRANGTGGHVRSQDITLVSRLMPAPRQITTREELDALPRRTVIRDADGITCERARSSETWYCPLEDCDQTPFIALPATVLWTPEETA